MQISLNPQFLTCPHIRLMFLRNISTGFQSKSGIGANGCFSFGGCCPLNSPKHLPALPNMLHCKNSCCFTIEAGMYLPRLACLSRVLHYRYVTPAYLFYAPQQLYLSVLFFFGKASDFIAKASESFIFHPASAEITNMHYHTQPLPIPTSF